MAKIISVEVNAEALKFFARLSAFAPRALASLYHEIGYQGRKAAQEQLLSGQRITFRGADPWRDSLRRDKISWSLLPAAGGVRIRSYPLNFPQYHSILQQDLRSIITSSLPGWIAGWEREIEKRIKKEGG